MKGVCLHDKSEKGEKVDMEMPEGWERFYPPNKYGATIITYHLWVKTFSHYILKGDI